jgi:hypothetical protein
VTPTPPPPPPPPPPTPNATQSQTKAERREAAAPKEARKRARLREAKGHRTTPAPSRTSSRSDPAQARTAPNAKASEHDLTMSPVVTLLLIAAALVALLSVLLAALPLGTLERMLAVEAHYRAEEVVNFVDGHRVDIAVAGIATLLVAAVVVIPTVTG